MSMTIVCPKYYIFILHLFVIIFKIFGLAPFTINISSNIRKKMTQKTINCSYSVVGSSYNIIASIGLLLMAFLLANKLNSKIDLDTITVRNEFELIFLYGGNISCAAILLINSFNQRTSVMIINEYLNWKIGSIEKRHNKSLQKEQYFQIIFFTMHIVLNSMLIISEVTVENNLYLMVNVLPGFILGFILVQYAIVLTSIKNSFHKLNNLLELMTKPVTAFPYDEAPIRHIMSNNFITENMNAIKQSYRALHNILNGFSNIYTWPIIFALIYIYIELTYCIYYLITPFIYSTNTLQILMTINSFLWILKNVFVVIVLTGCAMKIVVEVCIFIIIYNCII